MPLIVIGVYSPGAFSPMTMASVLRSIGSYLVDGLFFILRHSTALLVVGLLFGLAVISVESERSDDRATNGSETGFEIKNYVYTCAQREVERMLKSPSTAEFPWHSYEDVVARRGQGRYVVRSYVDAQNSFGAMRRVHYRCTVQFARATKRCAASCQLSER